MQQNRMRVHTLVRLDRAAISDASGEIRVFMTVRNEILRLSQTLEHYRKIRVTRFFVVDNGSTDGTRELLTAQPDCHVFLTRSSYAEARFGLEWQQALLDQYGVDHWCLVVDADEWFIYPGYESKSLPELAAYLQQSGAQGMFAFLLDMYGSGAVAEAISKPQRSMLDACRYFDTQYLWDYGFRAMLHLTRQQFPPSKVIGGPRWRLLFPMLHRHYYILKAMWRISDQFKLPLPVALRPAPNLRKIPFVRWLPGTHFPNPHATTPIKLSDVTGVLLHFKFLEDFSARVNIEVGRKEHWQGASEYRRYLTKVRHEPGLSFHYDGSAAYENSEQLVRLGLMRDDDAWMRLRAASSPHGGCVDATPETRSRDLSKPIASREKRLQQDRMRVHTLVRIDRRTISDCSGEIRAIMTVRNEILRLSQTLEHYRKIGVTRFFVIDNGSTDGTTELLTAQPDCHVFLTHNSYSEARLGLEWQHALLDEYGVDHWCLIVDADEWFIYPGYENESLPELAAYLEQSGAQGVFAFLLDMYGRRTVAEVTSESQHSMLDACRYFDGQYIWDKGFRIPGLTRRRFPPYRVAGGPRWRLLFPTLHRHYYLLKVMWLISGQFRIRLPVALRPAPTLRKIPFVRWSPGMRYPNPHETTPIKLSDVTGVLLHFKLLEDFSARLSVEINPTEQWDGASLSWAGESARCLAKLRSEPGLSFYYDGSVGYEDSEQLVRLGLIREDEGWMRIRTGGDPHKDPGALTSRSHQE